MKKILTAFIEQVIQFDDEGEYKHYISKLKETRSRYKIIDEKKDADGKMFITIRKQYNNNVFPD